MRPPPMAHLPLRGVPNRSLRERWRKWRRRRPSAPLWLGLLLALTATGALFAAAVFERQTDARRAVTMSELQRARRAQAARDLHALADNLRFLRMLDNHGNIWSKVTCPERMTLAGPPYDDVVPFGRRLVELFPDRVLWGTDWPHPNMKKVAPDDGVLVDYIPKIAPTPSEQQALLVDNPMRLYWA